MLEASPSSFIVPTRINFRTYSSLAADLYAIVTPTSAPRHHHPDDPHERVQEYRRAFERMRETVEFLLFEYYIEQEDRELRRIVAAVDRLPEPTPSYTWRPRPPAVQQPPEVHRLVRTAGVVVRSRRRRYGQPEALGMVGAGPVRVDSYVPEAV